MNVVVMRGARICGYAVLLFAAAGLFLEPAQPGVAGRAKIERVEIQWRGQKRSYYIFVPDTLTAEKPAPLLLTLHGQGRTGRILLEEWKGLAEKEGIILVGPDAPEGTWNVPRDGPQFLHDVVEEVRSKFPVDPRRLYIFGHSAGGTFGLYMSLLESEYFAATAVSAGALRLPDDEHLLGYATRKIPFALFVGTQDPLVPVKYVRATREALAARGIPCQATEIPGHTHDYYSRSKQINRDAWDFLKTQALPDEPRYWKYQ